MRLFVGIPLLSVVIRQLTALCTELRSPRDGLRWTAPESWHITLKFLGSTSPEQCECVIARLRAVRRSPFPIQLETPNIFDRAGIFFAGVRLTPALLALEQQVTAATEQCGFVAEARPYRPHITLARGQRQNLRAVKKRVAGQGEFASFVAQEFCLYESFLESSGARYEVQERFGLDQANGLNQD
jgi:2'-5' RNA ligase